MRLQMARLVFRKDWREVSRNWEVVLPMAILPLIFSVVFPLIGILSSGGARSDSFESLPINVQQEVAGMTAQQAMLYFMLLYYFAPFFLIIPLMASSVIASDSFAGEKERKTIEALLATPISDSELFLGKILVSFIPSMIITVASFLAYSTLTDALCFTIFGGRLLLPNLVWIMLIFGLAPTVALAGIGLTIIISARVKGFREAQQISVVLILPILALIVAQASGAVFLGPLMVGALIGGFAILDLLVFNVGIRLFGREQILARLA